MSEMSALAVIPGLVGPVTPGGIAGTGPGRTRSAARLRPVGAAGSVAVLPACLAVPAVPDRPVAAGGTVRGPCPGRPPASGRAGSAVLAGRPVPAGRPVLTRIPVVPVGPGAAGVSVVAVAAERASF